MMTNPGLALLFFMAATVAGNPLLPEAVVQNPEREVFVQSWKRGSETIRDRLIKLSLRSNQKNYSAEILGLSGKRYRLIFVHNPLPRARNEHWQMQLREILKSRKGHRPALGTNLLMAEGPGPGGDNFPRENLVGYFYPEMGRPSVTIGGFPWTDGYSFYPLKTIRKIKVENFYVVAWVESYRFKDTKKKSKLESLDVSIQFESTQNNLSSLGERLPNGRYAFSRVIGEEN